MSSLGSAVRLRPVSAIEFPAWIAESRSGYAHGIEVHGGQAQEEAQRKAHADTAALLTHGFDTPGQYFYAIEAEGGTVGRLWLGERVASGRRILFVWDLAIHDGFQGRGYGRSAMELAEAEARNLGFHRIELHVFGGNAAARGLYRSLGYVETSVRMAKVLGDP